MPKVQNKIKGWTFYNVIAVLTVLESLLILAGILPPLAYNSAGAAVFSVAQIITVAAMGRSLAKFGIKAAAKKGARAGLLIVAIISVFTLIGYVNGIPVLGLSFPAAYYLPVALFSMAIANALLFAAVAVIGAAIALKKSKRKK